MREFPRSARLARFGIFEVDLRAGELRKKGLRIKLQSQPFLLLVTLLKQPGELVTREELCSTLWPDGTFIDFDHSLGTAINKLREVLGDSASNPRFIETVPRRGYRFVGQVSEDAAGMPRVEEKDCVETPNGTPRLRAISLARTLRFRSSTIAWASVATSMVLIGVNIVLWLS